MTVIDRFFRYVSFPTTSDPHADEATYPSNQEELVLLSSLRDELAGMGLTAKMDAYGYVTAVLPANVQGAPVLGLLAHVDTSPAVSGRNVKARILHYAGGDILLDEKGDYKICTADNPELAHYVGEDLIVTDGSTLLGADDKAGVAEIMTLLATLIENPSLPHGEIRVAFTPDEEIGRGTDHFDTKDFGADFAYTVDGGELGEIEYENFNAAAGELHVTGISVHPGSAKGKMKNAVDIFADFHAGLPRAERPDATEGYEGFYMADEIRGGVEELHAAYIIRDHDRAKLEERKAFFLALAQRVDEAWGGGCVHATVKDSYYNMAEIVMQHPHLIENAKAAMLACGVEPRIIPIRGGTDGARLSFEGLPCPNLSTGGLNFHGRQEYIPVKSLETMVDVLVHLVGLYAKEAAHGV